MILPPDPEEKNDERAEWAHACIELFRQQTGADLEDALCDLLADLAHWCDRNNLNFVAELRRGRFHYDEETDNEGTQMAAMDFLLE